MAITITITTTVTITITITVKSYNNTNNPPAVVLLELVDPVLHGEGLGLLIVRGHGLGLGHRHLAAGLCLQVTGHEVT